MQNDDYIRELILVSEPSLRLGDSAYWLHNLNKHHAPTSFVILTDPLLSGNPLLMKPLLKVSNVKTFHSPIDPNLT